MGPHRTKRGKRLFYRSIRCFTHVTQHHISFQKICVNEQESQQRKMPSRGGGELAILSLSFALVLMLLLALYMPDNKMRSPQSVVVEGLPSRVVNTSVAAIAADFVRLTPKPNPVTLKVVPVGTRSNATPRPLAQTDLQVLRHRLPVPPDEDEPCAELEPCRNFCSPHGGPRPIPDCFPIPNHQYNKGCACPFPECMVRRDRGADGNDTRTCVRNPHYAKEPQRKEENPETNCIDAPPSSPLPNAESADPVEQFKFQTSWLFNKWWDWKAQCVPLQKHENFTHRSYHNTSADASGLYTIENGCLDAYGGLHGFDPHAEKNLGKQEYQAEEEELYWFAKPRALPEPPSCFVDTPVLLVPMPVQNWNHYHVLHRSVSAMLATTSERLFNTTSLDEVLMIFVILEPRGIRQGNAFSYYYQMFTRKWASVWAYRPSGADLLHIHSQFPNHPRDETGLPPVPARLCFKKMYVLHQCIHHCDGRILPWHGRVKDAFLFTTGGPRAIEKDSRAVQLFRSRAQRCLGLPNREGANVTNPRILYVLRTTTSRRHVGLAVKLQQLQKMVFSSAINARSFDMAEHIKLLPDAYMRLAWDSDIMIGHWGAGLVFQMLMPSGAVTAQFDTTSGCSGGWFGWNKLGHCDYGGDASVTNTSHFVITIKGSHVNRAHQRESIDINSQTYAWMLKLAKCGLQRFDPGDPGGMNVRCPFPSAFPRNREFHSDW